MQKQKIIQIQEQQIFFGILSLLFIYGLYAVLGTPSFLFFLLVIGSAFGLTVIYPRAGFLALLVTTLFFERFFTLEPLVIGEAILKLYPLDVLLGATFLGIFLSWQDKQTASRLDRSLGWLLGFFVYTTILFLLSSGEQTSTSLAVAFSTWKQYVFYGGIALMFPFLIREKDDIKMLVKVFLGGVVLTSFFLFLGALRGGGLWTEYTPLSTSGTRFLAFPHAFYFSIALLSLLLSLPYWYRAQTFRKPGILFLWVLALGILGSLMRHLWLGIGGVLVMALLIRPKLYVLQFSKISLSFLVPLLTMTLMAWYLVSVFPNSDRSYDLERATNVVSERIVSIGNERDESLAWRGVVWESALKSFAEQPLMGIGFGKSVPVELSDYQEYVEVRDMHNSWLALLIQTGVIGIVLLGGFLASLLIQVSRLKLSGEYLPNIRRALLGLLLFQVLVFFSQPYLETNLLGIFFWLTLGLLRTLLFVGESDKKQSD